VRIQKQSNPITIVLLPLAGQSANFDQAGGVSKTKASTSPLPNCTTSTQTNHQRCCSPKFAEFLHPIIREKMQSFFFASIKKRLEEFKEKIVKIGPFSPYLGLFDP
jgi:hypothetical protein